MSVSLDALAMAGVDWAECGKSVEEWEQEDLGLRPPAHLLAGADDKEEEDHQPTSVADAEGVAHDVHQLYSKLGKLFRFPIAIKAWLRFHIKTSKVTHALEMLGESK